MNNLFTYHQLNKSVSSIITCLFFIPIWTHAQINPTYDLPKPKAFENRKLASELTPDKKINPVKRVKQNIVTHYNFHFNASNKLEKVIQSAKLAYKDTFTQLLRVHNFTLDQTAQQKQELDSVILKSNNGILLHDLRNDWVDDLYLLMGKAYFYRKQFDSAIDVFQFINYNFQPRDKNDAGFEKTIGSNLNSSGNVYTISTREKAISKHTPVRNDALLWIAKTLIEIGQYDEARSIIETLNRDKFFPARLKNSLYECKGDLFYRNRQFDSAAYYLGKSQSILENNTEKSRRAFLVAQLYSLAGRLQEADSSFEKAILLTTDPVMEAYARINQIGLSSADKDRETRIKENIEALLKMAGREKYAAYRGIIYSAAAELEKSRNHFSEAVQLLILSNRFLPSEEVGARNLNYISIAELSFESKAYPLAKTYYDSATISGHVRESSMKIRKSVVTDLVNYLNEVNREDSLQKIALMPEQERDKFLNDLLKKMEKERDGASPAQRNFGQTGQRARLTEDLTGAIFPSGQQKGEWYFNNPSLKAKGSQSFQLKWGNRLNEDNWRRSSSAAAAAKMPVSRSRVVRQAAPEEDDDVLSLEKLSAGLPLSGSALQESNRKKANAARQLALLYRNKLGDCTSSIEWNELVLQTNNTHPELEIILYDLCICCKEKGLTDKSARYLAQLEKLSPNGTLLEKIQFPELAGKKSNERAKAASQEYEKIYNLFLAGAFKDAVVAKKRADSIYGQTAWTPQLMYLEAVYQIKSREDSLAVNNLIMIGQLFPSSPLATKATQLANVVRRRAEIESELKNMNVVRIKDNNVIVDADADAGTNKTTEQIRPAEMRPVLPALTKAAPTVPLSKDTQAIKIPEQTATVSAKKEAYVFNASAPHAAIMFMYNVDVVYINEAKRALSRYHSIQFADKELTVNNDKIGNIPFIIISFFPNASEAMSYIDQTTPIASKEIFPWLQADKYKFYILSPDHLKTMMEEGKTDDFIRFIKAIFPGKF